MTPTFWTWATEHWFLTFILALLALRVVSKAVRMVLAPIERIGKPPEDENAPVVQTTETVSEEDDDEESVEDDDEVVIQGVAVPTRFERL